MEIKDLRFRYPSATHDTLRIPGLVISGRGLIALTGPSGAGKSTFVELLAGTLKEPYSGTVHVLGRDLADLHSDAERQRQIRRIGFIPQDYGLLPGLTVRGVLEQDLRDADIPRGEFTDRIARALERVQLEDFSGRPVERLSGGQRQRVAIARMLARDVELVIADEPTANLDRSLVDETMALFRGLASQVPVIVITHDPAVAETCDRTVVLQAAVSHEDASVVRPSSRWPVSGRTLGATLAVLLLGSATGGIVYIQLQAAKTKSGGSVASQTSDKPKAVAAVTPSPSPSAGTVSGQLTFGADSLPAMEVFAVPVAAASPIYKSSDETGSIYFNLTGVPPGQYRVVAALEQPIQQSDGTDFWWVGAYSTSQDGKGLESLKSPTQVAVASGQSVTGVNITIGGGISPADCQWAKTVLALPSDLCPSALSPRSGIYVDGSEGTPHYFLSLTNKADGTWTGAVDFLAQDGQTSVVFTFSGTSQGGVATLMTSTSQTVSATYGSTSINLGECTGYLQFATSNAQCMFQLSPTGPAGPKPAPRYSTCQLYVPGKQALISIGGYGVDSSACSALIPYLTHNQWQLASNPPTAMPATSVLCSVPAALIPSGDSGVVTDTGTFSTATGSNACADLQAAAQGR